MTSEERIAELRKTIAGLSYNLKKSDAELAQVKRERDEAIVMIREEETPVSQFPFAFTDDNHKNEYVLQTIRDRLAEKEPDHES